MTNPDSIIGTNAAYNGRTSVKAFNGALQSLTRGILSGWACKPAEGGQMKVQLGGDSKKQDVAIAEDSAGNKTLIVNTKSQAVEVTIGAAPTTGSNGRTDSIVAYVDNPPDGGSETVDNPSVCGLIVVPGIEGNGTGTAPTDDTIRKAITTDQANGEVAYYVKLADVKVAHGQTTISQSDIIQNGEGISARLNVMIQTSNLADGAVTNDKIANGTIQPSKIRSAQIATTTTTEISNSAGIIGYDITFTADVTESDNTPGWLKFTDSDFGYTYGERLVISDSNGTVAVDHQSDERQLAVLRGADQMSDFGGRLFIVMKIAKIVGSPDKYGLFITTSLAGGKSTMSIWHGFIDRSGGLDKNFSMSFEKGSSKISEQRWTIQPIYKS